MAIDLHIGDTGLIIATAKRQGVLRNQLAYILATAKWETAHTMRPVKEAYWLSEEWRRKNLRYWPWYGRGYVQLTWQDNYIRAGRKLGLDLTTNPDTVMEPEVAAQILVTGSMEGWFTGKKIPDYITLDRSDFTGARRVINGTDKAKEIAAIAEEYDAALFAEGYGVEPEPDRSQIAPPIGAGSEPEIIDGPKFSIFKTIIAALRLIFARKS